ncbi:hypothetical protein HKX48_004171 [Thoreauomyces humboldtii]|nr:hypothetical protein HKX48_004171 [Thoreauomyces humboldtii]
MSHSTPPPPASAIPNDKRRLRVALLVCDTPLPIVVETAGDYVVLFGKLFDKANQVYSATTLPLELEIVAFDVTRLEEPSDIHAFDAYVLTGSKFSAYEQIEWIVRLKTLVQRIDRETKAKVVGICFGHQIVAEALGGKVVKNPAGWEVGWTRIELTKEGVDVLETEKTVLMHQDHVSIPPTGFKVLSSTVTCPIQMMIKEDRYLTIQGHPEFTANVVREIVKARQASKVFSTEAAEAALAAVDNPVDNVWFGEKFLGFMVGVQFKEGI